ncbi:MAG: adenylate/guanylate cyclase domain-containing protein [Variovorax paradoxus]|uniref:Adenylate/guanylate cyclase domain-containing protein n=1 Tax=Variovorax paradoxus TaxID=34073 RepID=A0A2W5QJM6_VARPD|nr:MAG: adenylate/guanylate cyclase domain-containing protein [Variovorax paradoxus]
MIAGPRPRPSAWPSRRDLRWGSGLVMMAYVGLHLLNHAMGLVSLAAAEAVLAVARAVWHSLPGTVLLYGAASVHIGMAVAALWERRTLRMPWIEAVRLVLGLSLPLLLASHLTAMRWAHEAYGIDGSYLRVVGGLWDTPGAVFQLSMMTAAWTHGCLGLHLALRSRAPWRRAAPALFALALLLPLSAAAGFMAMGREIARVAAPAAPPHGYWEALDVAAERARWAYAAALAALLLARTARGLAGRLTGTPMLTFRYPGRAVPVPRGWSVLEASRAHRIAHLSVCGGRARCSTCRVRVRAAPGALPAPSAEEARTLARVHAPADVRLACQLRPHADIDVLPLFAPPSTLPPRRFGTEREVAVLFVDLRRWSGLAERQWPFDLVYVLDRYFSLVGEAVRASGGVPNQFIGDSVMAIFGLESGLPAACRAAIDAALRIDAELSAWGDGFASEFGQQLDFGMGLHAGRAAVGEVGYLDTTTLTAVGEVVNTASRLQDHSKVAGARLVLSEFAATQAGLDLEGQPRVDLAIRGRTRPLKVCTLGADALAGLRPAPAA